MICFVYMYKFGPVQRKILVSLLGGAAMGISSSPRQYFKVFRSLKREWKTIDKHNLKRSIAKLSSERLVEEKILSDGSFKLVLTKKGKEQAKKLSLFGDSIKFKRPKRWDGKWRIVVFDVPEKDKAFRNILRNHLKELKFYKLQQSVFISPYPYEKPILELVDLYSAQLYVKVITAIMVNNEKELKKHFFKDKSSS